MHDSRLTNAYNDIRADIYGLGKIALELDERVGEIHDGPSREILQSALSNLRLAVRSLELAVAEIRGVAGSCKRGGGMSQCSLIAGHGGDHSNGIVTWDEDAAERADAAAVASMGGRTE